MRLRVRRTYCRARSYARTCSRARSYAMTCSRARSYARTCSRARSYAPRSPKTTLEQRNHFNAAALSALWWALWCCGALY